MQMEMLSRLFGVQGRIGTIHINLGVINSWDIFMALAIELGEII